jgi:hypothetical protein
MEHVSAPKTAVEVFISYSHRDERMRADLEEHLALLRREGLISVWHDRQIGAGSEWAESIDVHLDTAGMILLLVTPSFMASDYAYDREMKRAMERHDAGEAIVVPIIARPVDWQSAPFARLQSLPRDGRPIATWQNRGEAWLDVALGIRGALTRSKG